MNFALVVMVMWIYKPILTYELMENLFVFLRIQKKLVFFFFFLEVKTLWECFDVFP